MSRTAEKTTPAAEPGPPADAVRSSSLRQLIEALVCLALGLILCREFQVEGYVIASGSMAPNLNQGDHVLVHKHAFGFQRPRRWDVVVFRNPRKAMQAYVKRVVGLPGERVQIVDGDVYADGRICRKNLATQRVYYTRGRARNGVEEPYQLGPDEYFVLGDNSPVSSDSRNWPGGGVSGRLLLGKPFLVYLPSRPGEIRIGKWTAHIRIPDFSRIRYIR